MIFSFFLIKNKIKILFLLIVKIEIQEFSKLFYFRTKFFLY